MTTIKEEIKNGLSLLGKHVSMESFSDRIFLQKIMYILKCAGMELPSGFGWYVRGPYSSQLANEAFSIKEEIKDISSMTSNSSDNEKRIIASVKQFLGSEINDSNKLELYASVLFLKNNGDTDEKIIEKITTLKSWYKKSEVEEALKKLRLSKLFSFL